MDRPELARTLGLAQLVLPGVGTIVGAGIYSDRRRGRTRRSRDVGEHAARGLHRPEHRRHRTALIEEARQLARDMPRALLAAVLVTALLYLLPATRFAR